MLAEVGQTSGVKVEDDEVTRALVDMVRRYPGQEKEVWEFYRKNPQALAEVRAPLFEEKVVDHILGQAKVTDRPVSREDLFRVDPEDVKLAPAEPAAPDLRDEAPAEPA